MKTLRRWIAFGIFGVAVASACGGSTVNGEAESNTNWMRLCTSDAHCGSLSCECGVCSRPCDSAGQCTSLGTLTACVGAESLLGCASGKQRVCVPRCESDEDCSAFGSACEDEACGAGAPAVVDGGSGGSVSAGGASSKGGGAGRGDAAVPNTMDGSAAASSAIEVCPGEKPPESDPFDLNGFAIDGDTMTIDVHGGCQADEFRLCYFGPFSSAPPIVRVYAVYDSTRLCDPPQDLTLTFDLRPLRNYSSPPVQSGLLNMSVWNRDDNGQDVSQGSDFYHWGELNCFDRQILAGSEASGVLQQADRTCSTNDDCQWVSADTVCSQHCGAALSSSGAGDLAAALDSISEAVCGDYEGDGCEPEPAVGPCPQPPVVVCVDGACTREP